MMEYESSSVPEGGFAWWVSDEHRALLESKVGEVDA